MFIFDDDGSVVNSECSLDLFHCQQCIVIESSGGASLARGVQRRNPDYNRLFLVLLQRLAAAGIKLTNVVLDSSKVANIPLPDRAVSLVEPYPIDLSIADLDDLRRRLGRQVALMHRSPTAAAGGNAQKRIRLCLDRAIDPMQLVVAPGSPVVGEVVDSSPRLSVTERTYLRAARVGQGRFRESLVNRFGGKCAITGIEHPDLLVASHIKPWKACSNFERLDPNNGVLLSALIDRLFDHGLVTFSSEGGIVVSPRVSPQDAVRCGLAAIKPLELPGASALYMSYHRAFEYKQV